MARLPQESLRTLAGINANLFIALAALLDARSVTKAARSVGVSQSAMSQTLRQLRSLFGDVLLERSGNTMFLTPFAERLAPELFRSVASLSRLTETSPTFDPFRDAATFRLAARDQFALPLAGPLLRRWRSRYPNLRLNIVPYPGTNAIPQALARRAIDLGVAVAPSPGPEIARDLLFEESFCCLMRAGHPLDRPDGLELDDYLAADHGIIATTGEGDGAIDVALRKLGHERSVVLRMASFLGTPLVCASMDLLVSCPERLARFLCEETTSLSVHPLPFDSPRFSVWSCSDPARRDGELAFFREEVVNVMRELGGERRDEL